MDFVAFTDTYNKYNKTMLQHQHSFAQEHKQNKRKNVICNFIELINYVTSYKLQHGFEIYTQR